MAEGENDPCSFHKCLCCWKVVLDERLSMFILPWDPVTELGPSLCKDIDLVNKAFLISARNLTGIFRVKHTGAQLGCGSKRNIHLKVSKNRWFPSLKPQQDGGQTKTASQVAQKQAQGRVSCAEDWGQSGGSPREGLEEGPVLFWPCMV